MPESRMIDGVRRVLIGTAAAAVLSATPALADDDEHGPEVKVHDNGKDYKYEYKDRRCEYKYEVNYRTGEEKVEKKGDCRGVAPHRAVYHSEGPDRRYERDADWHDDERDRDDRDYDYDEEPHGSGPRLSCNREVVGQVLGGIAGGVAGAQVGGGSGRRAATIAGTIVGVMIGGNIGRRMDRSDTACAYQALEFAESDQTVFWRNPDSKIEYRITPQRRARRADGRECRNYKASVAGAGIDERSIAGVGCRRSDGSWEIESR